MGAHLDEDAVEGLRQRTVAVLLDARAAYLAAGASPLKHWDQLADRMRAAARTSTTVAEWATSLRRGLQLGAGNSSSSKALVELADEVQALGAEHAWLDMLEREHAFLIALARLEAEDRKERRDDGAA